MFLLFNIANPFKKFASKFWKYTWYSDKRLTTYKWFEIQSFIDSENIFATQLDLRFRGRDHAGPSLEVVLFCIGLAIRIYDQRHWDYEINYWEKYE
jgi:hypothetical protein